MSECLSNPQSATSQVSPVRERLSGEQESWISYDRWEGQLDDLRERFQAAQPFPHIALDNFLDDDVALRLEAAFPRGMSDWIHYRHYNESTFGNSELASLPGDLRRFMNEILSERCCRLFSSLSGVPFLQADPTLEGGGLHATEAGGFLRLHTDFTHHNRRPELRRRLNFILYLNRDWKDEWGGALELWNSTMTECVQKYSPVFNRAVLFATVERSYHGYPAPITPPTDVRRQSITSYYYTQEEHGKARPRSTHYVSSPGERGSPILVSIDNALLSVYSRIKRYVGVSDKLTGRILSLFRRR